MIRNFLITFQAETGSFHNCWVCIYGPLNKESITKAARESGIIGQFVVLMIQQLDA